MAGTTAAQWDQMFAVSTRAHFLVAAAALAVLEPGSAIVFISSAASLRAATGIPAYDASKAALLGVCRQVAREGMARGIRANLVVPSLVDTPLGQVSGEREPLGPGEHRLDKNQSSRRHRGGHRAPPGTARPGRLGRRSQATNDSRNV